MNIDELEARWNASADQRKVNRRPAPRTGERAMMRSAKFGPSALDGDVPVFVVPNNAPNNDRIESLRCGACRETGAIHCSDPENCGGPWTVPYAELRGATDEN